MKFDNKIWLCVLLFVIALNSGAQNESYLSPFSNPIIVNPGFSGLDRKTGFRLGNQFYHINKNQAYNIFYATYDTYSYKLKGGIGVYFQQGIIGEKNISTNEIGVAYSGFPLKTANGEILFSFNTNFLFSTKQWFVFIQDQILLKPGHGFNPPGANFLRYSRIKPRIGILWNTPQIKWGLTATYHHHITHKGELYQKLDDLPLSLSFNISGNFERLQNGLISKPYTFVPEFVLFYHEDFLFTRIKTSAELTTKTFGAFIQSDFSNNIHTIGGTYGIKRDNLRVNFDVGIGVPGISNEIGYNWELSLILIVPQIDYSKVKPWATKKIGDSFF